MATHRAELRERLETREDLDDEVRLVLAAQLALPARDVAARIVALEPHEARLRVLEQVSGQEAVVRLLPWEQWLRERPEVYARLAAPGGRRALPA